MHLKVRNMRLFAVAITLLLTLLKISNCSDDSDRDFRIQKEVEDFKEFLSQKFKKEVDLNGNTKTEWSGEIPEEYVDSDYHSVEQNPDVEDKDILQSSHKVLYSKEVHSSEGSSKETLDSSSNPEKKSSEVHSGGQHHPVEEFLFVRRSNAESEDPIVEVLDTILHEHSSDKETSASGDYVADAESVEQDLDGQQSADVNCQNNLNFPDTCPDGPEYEMQFPAMYSEILKQDMEKMLPEKVQDKCDYGKVLTTSASVEDRALCPFSWNISEGNSSRIPEYLFEAKCSCQLSRNGKKCVEMKRVIPVLWVIDCGHGSKKKYRQGWQEISVACVPVTKRVGHVLPNNANEM